MSRAKDLGKLLKEALSDYLLLVPLLVALTGYVLALLLSPDIDTPREHARWTSFFGTAAQVTATLFVVLVLEGRLAARTQLLPRLEGAVVTVIYVAIGILAAGLGLSPSLSDTLYCQSFALTVAGGVGALLGVVIIGMRGLTVAYAERDDELRDKVDEIYAAIKPPTEE